MNWVDLLGEWDWLAVLVLGRLLLLFDWFASLFRSLTDYLTYSRLFLVLKSSERLNSKSIAFRMNVSLQVGKEILPCSNFILIVQNRSYRRVQIA